MNKNIIIKKILENLNLQIQNEYKIPDGEHVVDSIYKILNDYVLSNLCNFDLSVKTVEGESKKVYKDKKSDICLIRLKPTLYSFTNNRYGEAKGTDILRDKLWKVFSDQINKESFDILYTGKGRYSLEVNTMIKALIKNQSLTKDYPFLTSFMSQVEIGGEVYNVCRYIENESPLEVVWKRYFLGTMKHNLLDVDKKKTKYGEYIFEEGEMPEIVRFDWRNPFEKDGKKYKDECIPDDFANFWIDVDSAKVLCKVASDIIKEFIIKKDYIFVDTCYFINATGNVIYSEITPDGMRIRKNKKNKNEEGSYDKDLWRVGKDSKIICDVWTKLYNDLKEIE